MLSLTQSLFRQLKLGRRDRGLMSSNARDLHCNDFTHPVDIERISNELFASFSNLCLLLFLSFLILSLEEQGRDGKRMGRDKDGAEIGARQ